jgi:hypothetical protein
MTRGGRRADEGARARASGAEESADPKAAAMGVQAVRTAITDKRKFDRVIFSIMTAPMEMCE